MKNILYIFLLVSPLVFTGCAGYEEIKVIGIKDVAYQDLDIRSRTLKLNIVATVHNPNFFNVRITNANMELRLHERVLGTVTQMELIDIEGRKQKDYTIRIAIEMNDAYTNFLSIYRVFQNNPKNLNLTGTVHVKSFLHSKTYKVERLSFQ